MAEHQARLSREDGRYHDDATEANDYNGVESVFRKRQHVYQRECLNWYAVGSWVNLGGGLSLERVVRDFHRAIELNDLSSHVLTSVIESTRIFQKNRMKPGKFKTQILVYRLTYSRWYSANSICNRKNPLSTISFSSRGSCKTSFYLSVPFASTTRRIRAIIYISTC